MFAIGDGPQFHSEKVPPCTGKGAAMTTETTAKPAPKIGLKAIEDATAATVFCDGGVDAMIERITAEAKPVKTDLATKAGRDAVASAAYRVSRAATFLDELGKEHVADLKKRAGAIDAMRRTLRDGLATLKDEIRAPLTAFEDAEKARIQGHDDALAAVAALLAHAGDRTSTEIEAALVELGEIAQRDWQEYEARAVSTIDHVREGLRKELATARQREADRAELERLRQEAAERERRDHEAKIAAEAADKARAEAEAQAAAERDRLERERIAAEQRAQQAEADRLAAIEQAEQDRQKAIEAERQRVADEQARQQAEAQRRERNKAHAAKINNEVLSALVGCGLTIEFGKLLIAAIVRGEIPHTTISY